MDIIINSFFTTGGNPITGLTPTIRIWEVQNNTHTLIVGNPDPVMQEVGDGFYKFIFTQALGYDETKNYLIRSDGGVGLAPGERYSVAEISEDTLSNNTITNITNNIWDETATNHIIAGSMGFLQNQTAADTASIKIDTTTAISLVQTLLKYDENRTKIDKVAKTLTIFDSDGITPLKIFDLKDSNGNPSITEICERVPQ